MGSLPRFAITVASVVLGCAALGCSKGPPARPVPPPEAQPELPPWYPEAPWNAKGADQRTFYMGKVVFHTAKHTIRPEGEKVLEQLASWLKANPDISRVRLEGHTDSRAGEEYNQKLSERRAIEVANWLVDHGIDHNRILAVAFGETRPLYDNGTADGRAENRRASFFPAEVAGRRFEDRDPTDGGLVITILSKEERDKAKEKGEVPVYKPKPVKNERDIFKPLPKVEPKEPLSERILDQPKVEIDPTTGKPIEQTTAGDD